MFTSTKISYHITKPRNNSNVSTSWANDWASLFVNENFASFEMSSKASIIFGS